MKSEINEIIVPPMGESIVEVTIGQLLAPQGSFVKEDEEIIEIETDKVNQVLYAPQAGSIHWLVQTGDKAKIGQTIGSIEAAEQGAPKERVAEPQEAPKERVTTPPAPDKDLQEKKEEKKSKGLEKKEEKKPERMEKETRRPLSPIRRLIAQRLVMAQQTMAMLTTFNEIDMTEVMHVREKFKEPFLKKHGCKLGLMPFFVKATLSALKAFPDLNSYLDGNEIVHREYYHIGVAVGTEQGVIVPVIRHCDTLSFAAIEQAIENYAKRAKEGSLLPNDLQGGGFTITNGGVYGSLLSTPILLPPQCGILGMHKIEKRAAVIDNQVVIRSMMYVALSYDHRLIDGKEAISFLVHIKEILEDPFRLELEV